MKWSVMLMSIVVIGCSQLEKSQPPVKLPVNFGQADLQECKEYQVKVLESPVKVFKSSSEDMVFTRNIEEARNSLKSFDVKKSLAETRANLVVNILNQCDSESIKKFDQDFKVLSTCSFIFSELNYFRALASALQKYPWPTELKLEGKSVALDYVKFYSERRYPLLNRLIALSVLDELSVTEIVNPALHSEIKKVLEDSKVYVESLRQKLNKDPALTCESLNIVREEFEYSDGVAKKMKDLLKRI